MRLKFNITWLGYIGFLGFIGFFWEPLIWIRVLTVLCIFLAAPYIKKPSFIFVILYYAFCQCLAFFRVRGRLPKAGYYSQQNDYCLPFEGFWVVANGGTAKNDSHSWNVFNQRYAYDFYIQDNNKLTHSSDGTKLEDYFSFGKPIFAASDGVVSEVNDGVCDFTKLGIIDIRAKDFRGNFVMVKHKDNEYSHMAHFKKGSIKVNIGDRVKQGQLIGLCGNSGHSTEPHLHFHIQDSPHFFKGIGLPVMFSSFKTDESGQHHEIKMDYINKGQKIKNIK